MRSSSPPPTPTSVRCGGLRYSLQKAIDVRVQVSPLAERDEYVVGVGDLARTLPFLEVTESATVSREAAAGRLRQLADQLARHNQIEFAREGTRYKVSVPDEVTLKVEIEVGEECETEFELAW
jgi:amphi-Trp domain-containing protein